MRQTSLRLHPLPGMGATTALINIAKQLDLAGIAPVIFSYHDDIDERWCIAAAAFRIDSGVCSPFIYDVLLGVILTLRHQGGSDDDGAFRRSGCIGAGDGRLRRR